MGHSDVLYPAQVGHVVDVALLIDVIRGDPERVREFHSTSGVSGARSYCIFGKSTSFQTSTNLPFSVVAMPEPVNNTFLPVAPISGRSPVCVPVTVKRPAILLPSVITSFTSTCISGNAEIKAE